MPDEDEVKKNIGFQGGISFLICSITGPGLLMIPAIYQSSGWFFPTLIFCIVSLLSGMSVLFLIESMTYFPGNKYFERSVEFTVLVHHFYGKKWYYLMHIIMYGSLQSFNIASIIQAVQNFDVFLVTAFGATCGYGISPEHGIFCVTKTCAGSSSPFGDSYMLITLGGLVFALFIIPLMSLNLDDNMIFQWFSLLYLYFVVFLFVIVSFMTGITPSYVPTVNPGFFKQSAGVIGSILFNFTLANTAPSWVNTAHPKVNLKKCVWTSVWLCTGLYVTTGIFGGMAVDTNGSDLLSSLAHLENSNTSGIVQFISLTFPILVLLTSIPVAFLVVRLNLVTSRLMSRDWATFYGSILPFIICIPFQTGTTIVTFTNWTSLIFQSLCNFIAPFLIYIFLDKRNMVMQQSVLDELENLDLDGGIKKKNYDDDEFDYVYHLPHADLSRLGPNRYDPFINLNKKEDDEDAGGMKLRRRNVGPQIIQQSTHSLASSVHSRRQLKSVLGGGGGGEEPQQSSSHMMLRSSGRGRPSMMFDPNMFNGQGTTPPPAFLGAAGGRRPSFHGSGANLNGGRRGSFQGSGMNLSVLPGVGGPPSYGMESRGGSFVQRASNFGGVEGGVVERRGSNLSNSIGVVEIGVPELRASGNSRRFSAALRSDFHQSGKVHPSHPSLNMSLTDSGSLLTDDANNRSGSILVEDDYYEESGPPSFKALPDWVTRRIKSRTVAIICFAFTLILDLTVIIYNLASSSSSDSPALNCTASY